MNYIPELQDVIRRMHGVESTHVESVPVKETFQGKTVWEGIVEIFEIRGDARTNKIYAWSHETDDPKKSRRHVTVLHIPPFTSPEAAVRGAIIHEVRSLEPEED